MAPTICMILLWILLCIIFANAKRQKGYSLGQAVIAGIKAGTSILILLLILGFLALSVCWGNGDPPIYVI